mgnify:FL=1
MLITTKWSYAGIHCLMFQRAKVQKMNANHNLKIKIMAKKINVSKSKSTKNEC